MKLYYVACLGLYIAFCFNIDVTLQCCQTNLLEERFVVMTILFAVNVTYFLFCLSFYLLHSEMYLLANVIIFISLILHFSLF